MSGWVDGCISRPIMGSEGMNGIKHGLNIYFILIKKISRGRAR